MESLHNHWQLSRLLVRETGVLRLIDPGRIEAARAERNYVRCYFRDGSTILCRGSLNGLQERLGKLPFLRTHRSALVNADDIDEVLLRDSGSGAVVLRSGRRVPMSRTGRHEIEDWLSDSVAEL